MTVGGVPKLQHIKQVDPSHLRGDRIQPGHPLFGLIWINPERVSGAPCFFGTRVPIQILFNSLAEGASLDEFLDGYEGVDREQAVAVLELARGGLLSDLEQL